LAFSFIFPLDHFYRSRTRFVVVVVSPPSSHRSPARAPRHRRAARVALDRARSSATPVPNALKSPPSSARVPIAAPRAFAPTPRDARVPSSFVFRVSADRASSSRARTLAFFFPPAMALAALAAFDSGALGGMSSLYVRRARARGKGGPRASRARGATGARWFVFESRDPSIARGPRDRRPSIARRASTSTRRSISARVDRRRARPRRRRRRVGTARRDDDATTRRRDDGRRSRTTRTRTTRTRTRRRARR